MGHYLIILERGEKNCSAYCPDLPGCAVTGKTIEQTIKAMESAIHFHLEGLQEQGEQIPPPQPFETHIHGIDADAGDLFAFVDILAEAIAA